MIMQTNLFTTTNREWPRSQIHTVVVGPTGISLNSTPILELQIRSAEKKLCGMLAGRDPAELAWMATLLRQALSNEPTGSQANRDVPL